MGVSSTPVTSPACDDWLAIGLHALLSWCCRRLISVSFVLNCFPQSVHVLPTGTADVSLAAVGVIGAKAGGWFESPIRMAFAGVAST